jgi:hypothetical protein
MDKWLARWDLNPAEFESHYGPGGLHPTKVNIPYPLFAKKQKISKKEAENKQKVQGVGFEPTNL